MKESVARRVGRFKLGGRWELQPPQTLGVPSIKLMEKFQDTLLLLADCQRSKSAPRIKNFRPIWTIRMRSSSMILRKCRTEKPASSAALGMSRNVLFIAHPSVDFISSSSYKGEICIWTARVTVAAVYDRRPAQTPA